MWYVKHPSMISRKTHTQYFRNVFDWLTPPTAQMWLITTFTDMRTDVDYRIAFK